MRKESGRSRSSWLMKHKMQNIKVEVKKSQRFPPTLPLVQFGDDFEVFIKKIFEGKTGTFVNLGWPVDPARFVFHQLYFNRNRFTADTLTPPPPGPSAGSPARSPGPPPS